MKIGFTKLNHSSHSLRILRADGSGEVSELKTAVFFLHDLAHFVVEKRLGYRRGFWGLLAAGHALSELGGTANPLTEELRFIEKIVGPVQSACMGHFEPDVVTTATAHLDYPLPEGFAAAAVNELRELEQEWQALPFGRTLELEW